MSSAYASSPLSRGPRRPTGAGRRGRPRRRASKRSGRSASKRRTKRGARNISKLRKAVLLRQGGLAGIGAAAGISPLAVRVARSNGLCVCVCVCGGGVSALCPAVMATSVSLTPPPTHTHTHTHTHTVPLHAPLCPLQRAVKFLLAEQRDAIPEVRGCAAAVAGTLWLGVCVCAWGWVRLRR